MNADPLSKSNSLTVLAAQIKIEHGAVDGALKRSIEHALAAGDLLLEAKAQLIHGQWGSWLRDHCELSERTAQLYMRIAKNRSTIEDKIRNGVTDLTLNQAAALLILTSDIQKLSTFIQQLETLENPEEIASHCIEHGVGVIRTPGYNPFAGRSETEKRDWEIFALFLVDHFGWSEDAAGGHIEWLLQRPFQSVEEWLGPEGTKFRKICGMRPQAGRHKGSHAPSKDFLDSWFRFLPEQAKKVVGRAS